MNATGLFASLTSAPQTAMIADALGAAVGTKAGAATEAGQGAAGQLDFSAMLAALDGAQPTTSLASNVGSTARVNGLASVPVQSVVGQTLRLITRSSLATASQTSEPVPGATIQIDLEALSIKTLVAAGASAVDAETDGGTPANDDVSSPSETADATTAATDPALTGLFIGAQLIGLELKSATAQDSAANDLAESATGADKTPSTDAVFDGPDALARKTVKSAATDGLVADLKIAPSNISQAKVDPEATAARPAVAANASPPPVQAPPPPELTALVQQLGGAPASIQGRVVSGPASKTVTTAGGRPAVATLSPATNTASLLDVALEDVQTAAPTSDAPANSNLDTAETLLTTTQAPAEQLRGPSAQDSGFQAAMNAGAPKALVDRSPLLPVATPQTVTQLAAAISQISGAKATRFQVELDPIGLGKVDVKIDINARGELTAALNFQNPHSAQELQARSSELQSALQQAGFDLSKAALHFTSGDQSGQSLLNQQQQQRQGDAQPMRAGTFGNLADTPLAPTARSTRAGGVDVMI